MKWWSMSKKPEAKKPDPSTEAAPPKVLTEAEMAARIARVRTLTWAAERYLDHLKDIKKAIEAEGASIAIVADPHIEHYAYSDGKEEAYRRSAYTIKASYSAAL